MTNIPIQYVHCFSYNKSNKIAENWLISQPSVIIAVTNLALKRNTSMVNGWYVL